MEKNISKKIWFLKFSKFSKFSKIEKCKNLKFENLKILKIWKFWNLKIWKFEDFVVEIFVFENLCFYFLEHIFLHDEKIVCVQMFFCDQVCISSNPRNHLEHSQCPYDDSEGGEAPPMFGPNSDSASVIECTPGKDFPEFSQSWGC